MAGVVDMKPADPIEGMLISQLVVANEAALSMYQRAWAQPPEYFEARMKYLARADKAARTAMMLTERLDHHRGRGQQQIIVKHITVNADQAVVTDSVVTGTETEAASSAKLLAAVTEKPMEMIEAMEKQKETVPAVGGDSINPMQRAHAAPRCTARSKRTGKLCRAPAVRGWQVCRMHGARGGAPEGKRNGNYRHGVRSKEMIELQRLIKSFR
jgi:hypothetical protein